jgi:hypothetical protein
MTATRRLPTTNPPTNHLRAALDPADFERIAPALVIIPLTRKEFLYRPREPSTRVLSRRRPRKRDFEQPVVGAVSPQKGQDRSKLPMAILLDRTGRNISVVKSDVTGARIRGSGSATRCRCR